MRIVTLEEHFTTPEVLKATSAFRREPPAAQMERLFPKLLDLGAGRIADMDEAGITTQVLSLTASELDKLSPETATALAHDVNDRLAQAVREHSDRFAGFATLGMLEPQQAGHELQRSIQQLGFCGAMVNGTTAGKFLDDRKFTPFWEAANALACPIYLHPAPPPEPVSKAYYSDLPGDLGNLLSIAGWGWHVELGLHVLRLILSGLFDQFPDLRIIIGHLGEDIPYSLARCGMVLNNAAVNHLQERVETYFHRHFWITSSGYFTEPPFQCARTVLGLDRLLFSVDYPYSSNLQGRRFLDSLMLSKEDSEAFAHGNSDALLHLPSARPT
jgi:hypothetical protein